MSAIRGLAARHTPFAFSQRMTASAGFHRSALRAAGKESHLHDEGRADEVGKAKDEQLKKVQEGKGHWEEGLASDSESIVKADRGEAEASEETIKKLQEETAKLGGQKSRT
ncbi:hypothetical protein BU23DRAFT_558591 [Bimuria novae-zelandiae CBS 107.79]|uniref:Mitochondrial carrier protein pet8 n=1 Tax=Bimuria novae-zelandiae CBS 107.79 TaxID=1447943 RepID=A0A6A5UVB8_9PLEO|nr:hypothetical protein BU23DRAFT_558591 [Bimuria novae-zelandiae CBS 107.79]